MTKFSKTIFAAALLAAASLPARADIVISEVAPYASGNTTYGADWFELTNTGSTAVSLAGWKMDDNSNSAGAAVALRGIGSIAAGQSVIFIESSNSSGDAALDAAFIAAWFGQAAPVGLAIGNYGGSGVGLSTSGDAVNIFDSLNALVTRVEFGGSTAGVTFDNAAGLTNSISMLSMVGTHGAFQAFNQGEIGSPGLISAVPEPASMALFLAGCIGLFGTALRRRD